MSRTHLIIPDTQIKPGVCTDHLEAIGNYIVDHKPDVIIHLGDHFDMHSLSSYDRGTKKAEGANYLEDINAGKTAMRRLLTPLHTHNRTRSRLKKRQYKPEMVFLLGNHENRIAKHINVYPELDGILGFHTLGLGEMGWDVVPFLEPRVIDGLTYSHYFYNPMSGRAYGGKATTKLNNIGFSFVMGHQQGLDYAIKHLNNGKTLRGLVAGSFYMHGEDYKGPQANDHWHGCLWLHEVGDGDYCLMELSMKYLLKRWGS